MDNCWGDEFETLYESYVSKGKARRTFKARELWYAILDAQIETGEWNGMAMTMAILLLTLYFNYSLLLNSNLLDSFKNFGLNLSAFPL